LRTPLTGILGFAKMLNEQIYGELNPKQLQYTHAIIESGKHLLELINDILDLSKIEAEKEALLIEKIAVEDICLASLSVVKQLAQEKNLALKLEINEKIGFCFCDQKRVKQILINLLSNGIKFTETGTITLKVTLEKSDIAFSVIDTGIGIKQEDQRKLFQPFVQLQTPIHQKYKGTGLGLALSLKLAKLHGGNLTLSSELEKGSCFTLYLPKFSEID
jgi:signal transduction histidine kinase